MPYKRKYRKRANTRRRPYRKRYNKGGRVVSRRGYGKAGIPDRMTVKMVYAETIRLSQSVVSFDKHVFYGSALFDPNDSGTGHQPRGYDQWAQFYNKSMCHASKIRCTFTPTVNNSTGNMRVFLLPSIDSSITPDWTTVQEGQYGKSSSVGPYVGNGIRNLSSYMTTKKIFGDVNGLEEAEYGATFGFNPNVKWYWIVGAETQDGTPMEYCDVAVVITYYVELYDRKNLPES